MSQYLVALSFFSLGFYSATILIVRASMRPRLKKVFRPFLGLNKAVVPKAKVKTDKFADQEI